MKTDDYEVSIANIFEAESHKDAIEQMIEWLLSHGGATCGGYRSTNQETGSSQFIDAETLSYK